MVSQKFATPKANPKSNKPNRAQRERALEEGLQDTLPASDPIAVLEPVADHADDKVN